VSEIDRYIREVVRDELARRLGEAGAPAATETLSATQAAEFLGVSTDALYAAANRGDLPHRRVGRRFLFCRRALVAWLEDATSRTADE